MKQHMVRPDPDTPHYCACGLPASNQRFHTLPPSVPDISEQRRGRDERAMPAAAGMQSATSVQAALDMAPRLTDWQQRVLAVFAEVGLRGLTDEELTRRVGPDNQNTIRPRRIELVEVGAVAALLDGAGRPVKRRNRSGREAVVYAITPAGRERVA